MRKDPDRDQRTPMNKCPVRNLQILELPQDFPTYSIKQFWYISNHNDKSHQWIRQVFYENLKGKDIRL